MISDTGTDTAPEDRAVSDTDDPIGPVTLPGRVRHTARAMALAGFMLGVGLVGAGVIAPPITTISSAIY